MKIESPAFENYQPIPKQYSCEGANISPPMNFMDIPSDAKSLALIVDDPDAPGGTFDHWIVWNLSPNIGKLQEGARVDYEGTNGFGKSHYGGPCPPKGHPHHYFFKLYALDTFLDLPHGTGKRNVEEAMKGHILAETELIGTYQR